MAFMSAAAPPYGNTPVAVAPEILVFASSKDFSGFAFGVNSSRVRYVWYLRAGDVGFNLLIPISFVHYPLNTDE
jgi:hypothetical protein